jgi:hypothetical protein
VLGETPALAAIVIEGKVKWQIGHARNGRSFSAVTSRGNLPAAAATLVCGRSHLAEDG